VNFYSPSTPKRISRASVAFHVVHTLDAHKLLLICPDSTKSTLRHPRQCPATRDHFTSGRGFTDATGF